MSKKTILFGLAFAFLLTGVSLFLSNCNQDKPAAQSTPATPGTDRPQPGASASLTVPPTAEDMSKKDRGASEPNWPIDMPGIVPRPAGVTLINFYRTTISGMESWTVYLDKTAKVGDLRTYEQQLKDEGYKTGVTAGTEGGMVMAKKDNIIITYTITQDQKTLLVQTKPTK
ncbi:MAG: hypothetical protein IPL65_20160 [Lewinellaceae bacterium]|nr:hypothetical protein [Lewinellaceae bacterium]